MTIKAQKERGRELGFRNSVKDLSAVDQEVWRMLSDVGYCLEKLPDESGVSVTHVDSKASIVDIATLRAFLDSNAKCTKIFQKLVESVNKFTSKSGDGRRFMCPLNLPLVDQEDDGLAPLRALLAWIQQRVRRFCGTTMESTEPYVLKSLKGCKQQPLHTDGLIEINSALFEVVKKKQAYFPLSVIVALQSGTTIIVYPKSHQYIWDIVPFVRKKEKRPPISNRQAEINSLPTPSWSLRSGNVGSASRSPSIESDVSKKPNKQQKKKYKLPNGDTLEGV